MSYEEEIAWGIQRMLDTDLQFPQETEKELSVFFNRKQELCSYCELTETDGACTETLCDNAMLRWLKQFYKEEI